MILSHVILAIGSLVLLQCLVQAAPSLGDQQPLGVQDHLHHVDEYSLSKEEKEELFTLHKNLVEIESISGNEGKVGSFLADYLKSKDFTVEKLEVAPERWNIFAYPGETRETDVLVTSHIDTVCTFSLCTTDQKIFLSLKTTNQKISFSPTDQNILLSLTGQKIVFALFNRSCSL